MFTGISFTTSPARILTGLFGAFAWLLLASNAGSAQSGQEKAIERIKALHGTVSTLTKEPGSPVSRVSLIGAMVSDEDVSLLLHFPEIQELNVRSSTISDKA